MRTPADAEARANARADVAEAVRARSKKKKSSVGPATIIIACIAGGCCLAAVLACAHQNREGKHDKQAKPWEPRLTPRAALARPRVDEGARRRRAPARSGSSRPTTTPSDSLFGAHQTSLHDP